MLSTEVPICSEIGSTCSNSNSKPPSSAPVQPFDRDTACSHFPLPNSFHSGSSAFVVFDWQVDDAVLSFYDPLLPWIRRHNCQSTRQLDAPIWTVLNCNWVNLHHTQCRSCLALSGFIRSPVSLAQVARCADTRLLSLYFFFNFRIVDWLWSKNGNKFKWETAADRQWNTRAASILFGEKYQTGSDWAKRQEFASGSRWL